MFFSLAEFDILMAKIDTELSFVDFFIITEGDVTFSGRKKEYVLGKELAGSPILEKIIYRPVAIPDFTSPWDREKYQRDYACQILSENAQDDDIVLATDCDEIINRLPDFSETSVLETKMYWYYLNLHDPASPYWHRSVIGRYKDLKLSGLYAPRVSPPQPIIKGCGWHYSYMGGEEAICDKLRSFSHQEIPRRSSEEIKDFLRRRWHFIQEVNLAIDKSADYPEFIKSNMGVFDKYILKE